MHPLPAPFFVLATQNPLEQEGTYPLPEAQLDRFLLYIKVDYPSGAEEWEVARRVTTGQMGKIEPVHVGRGHHPDPAARHPRAGQRPGAGLRLGAGPRARGPARRRRPTSSTSGSTGAPARAAC